MFNYFNYILTIYFILKLIFKLWYANKSLNITINMNSYTTDMRNCVQFLIARGQYQNIDQ